ncbi:MAG: ABC transporter permease [bacterium]
MFKNYLIIALRNIKRYKGYSILNIAGLALGMACCILILLYVQDELSFDKFQANADRLYRLTYAEEIGGVNDHYAMSPFAAAPAFTMNLPQISAFSRIAFRTGLITYENKKFDESGIMYADASFFEIFTFRFIKGNPKTALQDPGSIVLTEESAVKIFGKENPLGKTLNLNSDGDLKVTGIINNVPRNSHFRFNYTVSMKTVQRRRPELLTAWLSIFGWSYVLLEEGTDPKEVESKFDEIVQTHTGEEAARSGTKIAYELQKLTDIHLRSHLQAEIEGNGDIRNVYIFSMIAVFILGIACINFMNLSTARSANRSKEVGLRKVLGANKNRLISQFLSESIIMSLLGLLIAIIIVELMLPAFNNLTEKEISINYLNNSIFVIGLVGLVIFTGFIAGSFPAFFLSAFHPVAALRGQFSRKANRSTFRNGLVVLQFTISIILIANTILVLNQLDYMKDKKLGFDKEQVLVVRIKGRTIRQKFESFKNELLQNSNLHIASYANGIPGRINTVLTVFQEGKDESDTHTFDYFFVDKNFDSLYHSEERLSKIILFFAFVAIFIACLGLFALASFNVEQRTKEIGIRKVLGASVSGIVLLLSKEFTKWVLVSNIIAWPVAYYAMNKWLQNFAYRIDIGLMTFLTAGMLALVIASVTVCYQAIKAATANPVNSLRYE